MNILYIGDIMGRPGVDVVSRVLPSLRQEHGIDLVIAQAENVTEGKGMSLADMEELKSYGVDFFSGGNHTPSQVELHQALEDDQQPVIGPANMPTSPGKGWKCITTPTGTALVISLMGAKVGTPITASNPLSAIDRILDETRNTVRDATIINFHGDYSSEKRVIGYYLDGRVSAVVGDHWHVPTADAMVLPKGTAHITDVGMCGTLHSSLGIKTEIIIDRWRNGKVNKNEMELLGPRQFNALLVNVENGLASSVSHIQRILDH
jgi:metallophosphoesterase (TIGR00282 family)